jgi:hypothetical protein
MTVDEFDARFDILYNNIASNAAVPLDAYEKSVFLSQAHKELVIDLYNGRSVPGISFESTEEARAYLKSYIKSKEVSSLTKNGDGSSYIISYEDDCLFRVEETATADSNRIQVIPCRMDDLSQILENPFKGPSSKRVIRIDNGTFSMLYVGDNINLTSYTYTYVCKPEPIILNNIGQSSLEIDGKSCNVSSIGNAPEILHDSILKLAVALAKQAYIGQ